MTFAGLGRSGRVRQKGAAAVEFAIVAWLFLVIVLTLVEAGALFWVNLTMQHAVREGARYAVVGLADMDPDADDPQRYRAVIQTMETNSMGLWDAVGPVISVSLNGGPPSTYAKPTAYVPGMFGQPGDLVALQLVCRWPLATPVMGSFFDDAVYTFTVGATMRNEAFQ